MTGCQLALIFQPRSANDFATAYACIRRGRACHLTFGSSPDSAWTTRLIKRYLWTLDRKDEQARSRLSTESELIEILDNEALHCVMPPDWLIAGCRWISTHAGLRSRNASTLKRTPWTLQLKTSA